MENTILSRILSSISQGVLVAGPDHKILFSNRAFLEITEFCESDIIGNTCRIMQGPDTDKATVKAIRAALDAGVEFSGEILNYRKSGETFWNDLTITPHFNDDGSVGHFIGVTRNVTEQKRQQEEYTRSRALAAVGQLTGGIAHDFNNLLMIIQGNAELLEMADLSDHAAESVSLINKAADSAAVLIGRLMSFSRRSPLQTVCVNLLELIPNTVALLKSGIPESIAIHENIPEGIWPLAADPNALEQAIVNLAVNARDAMPDGGSIIIDCENRTVSGDMLPFKSELEPGDYVLVSVTDNGAGMSPDALARAFEPFFTTKDVGKGTGLGLSTVYGFATQSDGHVTIYSEPEQGTTVKLFLPRFLEAGAEEKQATETRIARSGNGQRILLVEDQTQLRAHVEKLLTKMGYLVTTAGHGKEALSLFDRGMEFDLLFTDVIMPGGINGQQLAEGVRKLDPRVKVLFTSGYPAFAFEHLKLDEIDSIRLLKKPYRSTELAAILAELFDC